MKNYITKFYGIFIICLMVLFCFAIIFISTDNAAKSENVVHEECSLSGSCDEYFENGEENYDYVYINYNGKHIQQNQFFIVPFAINSESKILDYKFEQNGFKVLNSSIISEKQIDFELNCIPNSSEYWLSVQIILKSKKIINGNLYAVSNDSGIFISQFSEDNALENYFEYALKNKLLTEDDVYTLTKLNYSKSVTETNYTVKGLSPNFLQPIKDQATIINGQKPVKYNANAKSGEDTYLEGRLEWEDDKGDMHPLRRIMVEIYDYDGVLPDNLLGTVFTDNNGEYSFAFENDDSLLENGGYDLYIRAYAGDNNAIVVKNAAGTKYWMESINQGRMNVSTGTTTDLSMSIDMRADLGRALQISQAILTARDYAWIMTGNMPSDVSVRYPYDDGCSYSSILNRIYITGNAPVADFPNSYASWDVIMHEYGHHIQYDENIIDSLGGWHAININIIDHYAGTNHDICNGECARPSTDHAKYEGIRIAWSEAWPTVFGAMAQKYLSSFLANIATVNDSSYTSYNGIDIDFDTTEAFNGDGCELSIMAVLWDLYDSGYDETNDTIALGYQSWWNVTTDREDKTFSDFIQSFYLSYPQYIDNIGANLSYYKMAPTGVTAPTSSVLNITPPTFSWTSQGGSTECPNNSFRIKVFNVNQTLSLTTAESSSTSCSFTIAQWNTILSWPGDTIYVAVAGYQADFPSTGKYESEYKIFTKPLINNTISERKWVQGGLFGDIWSSFLQNSDYPTDTRIRYSSLLPVLRYKNYSVNIPSGYYFGVQEYDHNGICRYDWGWQTGALTVTTHSYASYFGLVMRRADNSAITPADAPLISITSPTDIGTWEQGGIWGEIGQPFSQNLNYDTYIRIRSPNLLSALHNASYSVTLPSGYYIGIQEYDANSICRFDWGWQTGNVKITTRWDTTFFGIVLRRADNTVITPSDAPPIQLINTIKTGSWVQGGLLGNAATYFTYNCYSTIYRIRYSTLIPVVPNQQYKISVPSGFCIVAHEYDSDEILIYDHSWMSGTIMFTTISNTRYLSLAIRRDNNQAISPSDLPNITLAPIVST